MIQALLFDVGGPLDTEVTHERLMDQYINDALAAEGIVVNDERYADAAHWAVESFASNTYQAIIWRITNQDPFLARRVFADVASRRRASFELRDGMAALLKRLRDRGILLGLAANQPLSAIERLDAAGVGEYFQHREVSGLHGFHKPDARLFLRACEELEVSPPECIMVGDRIDNDVAPARLLGMRTILFRTGRHIDQQPRTWLEVPDAEVYDAPALEFAIERLMS